MSTEGAGAAPGLTPEQRLAAIMARCAAATTGPWYEAPTRDDGIDAPDRMPVAWVAIDCRRDPKAAKPCAEYEGNRAFIAHAREDVPWLLDRLTGGARPDPARAVLAENAEIIHQGHQAESWEVCSTPRCTRLRAALAWNDPEAPR